MTLRSRLRVLGGTKPAKIIAVAIVNLVLLEILSILAIQMLGVLRPGRRLDLFLDQQLAEIGEEEIERFLTNSYDPEIGWGRRTATRRRQNRAGETWTATYDQSGARTSCMETADVWIATYGDSFTEAVEVNDDQTWQCVLERRTRRRVANFGVAAYGVGQALLLMKRHWTEGAIAPITILAVYEDDLNRVVNRWWPYFTGRNQLSFKPAYRYLDGEVVFFPNPLRPDASTVEQIRALAIEVAPTDYWAAGQARVLAEFPFSLHLLRVGLYFIRSVSNKSIFEINLWNTTEGRALMNYLLRDFEESARAAGSIPVLLLIPEVNAWSSGRQPPAYDDFLTEELPRHGDLTVIDVADAEFVASRFSIEPFAGHASAYGNEAIANHILQSLDSKLGMQGGS